MDLWWLQCLVCESYWTSFAIKTLIHILPQSPQYCAWHHAILDSVITALDCILSWGLVQTTVAPWQVDVMPGPCVWLLILKSKANGHLRLLRWHEHPINNFYCDKSRLNLVMIYPLFGVSRLVLTCIELLLGTIKEHDMEMFKHIYSNQIKCSPDLHHGLGRCDWIW